MKIAISGKGGVGKSTLAGALALLMAGKGKKVLALDADPDANLASALGIPRSIQDTIIPISKQIALIEERTGAKVNQYGQVFKLNPEVSDIADAYATTYNGVSLLVLGASQKGGGGCACPENVFIRSLVMDLILNKDEALIMDMEAGVEHLGRATASGVDTMIVVVEPGQRSIDCAQRVIRMAGEIRIKNIQFVANKVNGKNDEDFIRSVFPGHTILDFIPYSEGLRTVDRDGFSILDGASEDIVARFRNILRQVEGGTGQ